MPLASIIFGGLALLGVADRESFDTMPEPPSFYHTKVGDCRVVAISTVSSVDDAARDERVAPAISFLLTLGRSSILVAGSSIPSITTERIGPSSKDMRSIDTIILPFLDERQARQLIHDGRPAIPHGRLIVDRSVFDEYLVKRRGGPSPLMDALNIYRSAGMLRLAEANMSVAQGLKLSASPARPNIEVRVRVDCGPTNLIIMNDDDLGFAHVRSGASRTPPEPRLARALASDAFVVGTSNGTFPGLGHLYIQRDGYQWGSVRARDLNGVPIRRGYVRVEEAGLAEPVAAPRTTQGSESWTSAGLGTGTPSPKRDEPGATPSGSSASGPPRPARNEPATSLRPPGRR